MFCSVFRWLDGWIGPAIAYGWGCETSLSNLRYLSCHPLFPPSAPWCGLVAAVWCPRVRNGTVPPSCGLGDTGHGVLVKAVEIRCMISNWMLTGSQNGKWGVGKGP